MKQGWEIKKLGEVCDFQNGFAFKSTLFTKAGYPILRISNIQDNSIDESDLVYFDKNSYKENFDRFEVYKGDIVIAMSGGTTGKLGINDKDEVYYLNQRVGKFTPKKALLKQYLYYFLHTKSEESLRIAGGAAQPNLSTEQIKGFEIPVPSLSEQERIVGILDSAFAKIEALRANAQQNLQNAKDLFQASLKQELIPKQGWQTKSVKEISKDIFAGGDAPQNNFSEEKTELYNIPIYANAVKDDGLYGYTDFARVIEPSLTIAARGSGTGYVLERKEAYLPIVRLIVIVPKEEQMLLRYLYYSFRGLDITRSGSAIPQLTVPMIKKYTISFPLIEGQKVIVEKLDALSERCRVMEENYKQTAILCNDLKQALLKQAFNGEL